MEPRPNLTVGMVLCFWKAVSFFDKHLLLCSFRIVQLSFHPTRYLFPKLHDLSFHKFRQTLIGLWHVWFSVKVLFLGDLEWKSVRYRALANGILTCINSSTPKISFNFRMSNEGLYLHISADPPWSTLIYFSRFPFLGGFAVPSPYFLYFLDISNCT